MNSNDPITVGLMSFLIMAALSTCCFLIAYAIAWFNCSTPRKTYIVRLVIMFVLLIAWWILVLPALAPAYIGNHADPRDADRRARWEARGLGRWYGAHTIWAWCAVALLHKKTKRALPNC